MRYVITAVVPGTDVKVGDVLRVTHVAGTSLVVEIVPQAPASTPPPLGVAVTETVAVKGRMGG